ncbi:IS1182 family transposase [Gottfriedia acidiceleris]|uniref:IS1182 family transposase n=2 Tax=Gottfriedia acidiceleris TaxID=371036 RepID=UPI000B441A5E|nr:IS1182 family transposase [Gottfriedia acidiceleris]
MYYYQENLDIAKNRKLYENMIDVEHHIVKIDKEINWNYLYQLIEPYYRSTVGRPSIDPLILVKILLIQYIEGFRSVRFTCKQVKQNATYRWFLGISLDRKIPCHSTISKFLNHRLKDNEVWEAFFHYVVNLINIDGFIANETWVADETELKANANKRKREEWIKEVVIEEDLDTLKKVNERRQKHGLKLLKPRGDKTELKRILLNPVDGDARLSVKHDERGRFAYFEHRVVDSLHNFIIDTHVTSANVPGHRVLLDQLDSLNERFGYYANEMAIDAGYYNSRFAEGLFKRGIFAYISHRRFPSNDHKGCRKTQFQKVNEDLYACPCGVPFRYKTTTRQGYHEFKPDKGSCFNCPFAKKNDRVLRISVNQPIYDKLREQRLSTRGKILKSVRPSTVELSFAQSKELHGLRYARYRGVQKVKRQVLMTAIIQNLIKWTKLLSLKEIGLHLIYQKTD